MIVLPSNPLLAAPAETSPSPLSSLAAQRSPSAPLPPTLEVMRTPPGQVPFPGLSAVPLELSRSFRGPWAGSRRPFPPKCSCGLLVSESVCEQPVGKEGPKMLWRPVKNLRSSHSGTTESAVSQERWDAGSIPSLAQWVKDVALVATAAQI